MSAQLRAVMALAWWAGFYLLGLALVGALLWVPWAEAVYSRQLGPSGLLAGGLGLTVAWALRPRFEKSGKRTAPPLERAKAPRLFGLIDEVARKCGTKPPDEVYLSLEATAFTALERRGWFKRASTLTLGLPLLHWFDEDELAAVVAHEFGHHVGHDVRLGPLVYRTRAALAGAIGQLDDSVFFLDVPFRAYGRLYLRMTASLSRAQELSADALSAKVAGGRASRNALRLVHEKAPLWQTYFFLDVVPFLNQGMRLPLLQGYRELPDAARCREAFRKTLDEHQHSEPSPWDTHPPLEQRLGALPQAEATRGAKGNALALLGDDEREQETRVLETTLLGEVGKLRDFTWDELGPWLAEKLESSLADTRLGQERSLESLPDLLADSTALSSQLTGGLRLMSREAQRRDAKEWLSQWLTGRLVAAGFSPRWRSGEGLVLVRGETTVVPPDLVDAVDSGALSKSAWAARCRELAAPPAGN